MTIKLLQQRFQSRTPKVLSKRINKLLFIAFMTSVTFLAAQLKAQSLHYTSAQLTLKDLDDMNLIVQARIRESKKAVGDKSQPLKDALRIVFSRPNSDHLIDKAIVDVRNELEDLDAWESTFKEVVQEALTHLKDGKSMKASHQLTYVVILENAMSELRPNLKEPFEKSVVTMIKDAKLEVSKEVLDERRLGAMKDFKTPSEYAKFLLDEEETRRKQAEKLAKENAKKNPPKKPEVDQDKD